MTINKMWSITHPTVRKLIVSDLKTERQTQLIREFYSERTELAKRRRKENELKKNPNTPDYISGSFENVYADFQSAFELWLIEVEKNGTA